MISPGCTGMVNNVSTEGKTRGSDHPTNPNFSRPSRACARLITLWIQVNTDGRIVFPKNFIHPIPDAALCPIGGTKLGLL